MAWTDQAKDFAKLRWAEGASATQIAVELNIGVSRNAVLGVLGRAGLLRGRRSTERAAVPKPTRRYSKRAKPMRWGKGGSEVKPATPPPTPEEDFLPLNGTGVGILELNLDTCRYPLWPAHQGGGNYCGRQVAVDRPYCAHHCAIAYTRVPRSRPASPQRAPRRQPTFDDQFIT